MAQQIKTSSKPFDLLYGFRLTFMHSSALSSRRFRVLEARLWLYTKGCDRQARGEFSRLDLHEVQTILFFWTCLRAGEILEL